MVLFLAQSRVATEPLFCNAIVQCGIVPGQSRVATEPLFCNAIVQCGVVPGPESCCYRATVL